VLDVFDHKAEPESQTKTTAARVAGAFGVVGIAGVILVGILVAVVAACVSKWSLISPIVYDCVDVRPHGLTTADLAGDYSAVDGGELELHQDGTFTASGLDITDPYISYAAGQPPLLSGSGGWTLRPENTERAGDIELRFANGPIRGLGVAGTREVPWLYWYVGDSDNCQLYMFTR
jgi:hypothetical protein